MSLIIKSSLDDFSLAYQDALRTNSLLAVENGNGRTRVVNPQQILLVEEEDDETREPARLKEAAQRT